MTLATPQPAALLGIAGAVLSNGALHGTNGAHRQAPEERTHLRRLHGQIRAAELAGEDERVSELLALAPTEYRAMHAFCSWPSRALIDELPSDDDHLEVRSGDVPSEELDALEDELRGLEDEDGDGDGDDDTDEFEELDEPDDISDDEPEPEGGEHTDGADAEAATTAEEPRAGVEAVAEAAEPTTPALVNSELAATPDWRTIGQLRRMLLGAARAEDRAVQAACGAAAKLAKLEATAREADAAVQLAANAARAAAEQADLAYGAVPGASTVPANAALAACVAERYQDLAEAKAQSDSVQEKTSRAREKAVQAREDALRAIRETHRVLVQASGAYTVFLAEVPLSLEGVDAISSTARGAADRPDGAHNPAGAAAGDEGSAAELQRDQTSEATPGTGKRSRPGAGAITHEIAVEMNRAYHTGARSNASLAEEHGVSSAHMYRITSGSRFQDAYKQVQKELKLARGGAANARVTRGKKRRKLKRTKKKAEAGEGDPVARFMSDPTVEGVAVLTNEELLKLATDWPLRDRCVDWVVCDGQCPIPPWVRARELVILEGRWRARHGEAPEDFEQRMSTFERNLGVRAAQDEARRQRELEERRRREAAMRARAFSKAAIAERLRAGMPRSRICAELHVGLGRVDRVRKELLASTTGGPPHVKITA